MKNILIVVFVLFSANAFADDITSFFGERLTGLELEMAGKGWKHIRTDIPNTKGSESMCFGGIHIIDKKSGLIVGEANDCLSNVQDNNGALQVFGTTFLNFFGADDVHTLIVQGNISVQPVTVPAKTAWGMKVTHITGSSNEAGNNAVIGGSGFFEGATGTGRISGMVDMSKIDHPTDPHIVFSCMLSVTDLQLASWAIR
jgi:hypothetical protein